MISGHSNLKDLTYLNLQGHCWVNAGSTKRKWNGWHFWKQRQLNAKVSKNACESAILLSDTHSNTMQWDIRQEWGKDMSLPTIWPESVGRSAEKLVGTETTVATWELWYENGHILLKSLPGFLVAKIWVEKKCASLHWRIIKASASKNSESVLPCNKSRNNCMYKYMMTCLMCPLLF